MNIEGLFLLNLLKWIDLTSLSKTADVFVKFATGVSLILGLSYIKTLKEKTNAATFSFWSQFRARIYELLSWLCTDYGLLDNLYEKETRDLWEGILAPDVNRLSEFKKKVEDIFDFIKSTPDQMPAYIGWTEDYDNLLEFLNDVIQYDICNGQDGFKFKGWRTIQQREEYCNNICQTIKNLCKGIENKQKEIEIKILKY